MHTTQPSKPCRQRWTVEEYERLAEQGFFANRRVELVMGEIVQMPAMRNEHAVSLGLVHATLAAAFGPGHWVRMQMPLRLGRRSMPEPDAAVVTGQPRDFQTHPTTALLVVEISDTSLAYDRNRKAAMVAAANIPEYWIVNLAHRQLEVFRTPTAHPTRKRRSRYHNVTMFDPTQSAIPLALPGAAVKVADLLP